MLNIITSKPLSIMGFLLFFIGFILNKVLLFGQGFLQWMEFPRIALYSEGLLSASCLLLIGIVMIWYSYFMEKNSQKVNH